jgi:DNA repair exonuclease SbcCD ATPase subunit
MLTLIDVKVELEQLKLKLIEKKGQISVLNQQEKDLEENIKRSKEQEKKLIQSKQLLTDTIEFARKEAKFIIESLVSKSLQYVFEDPEMKFEIIIKPYKNRTDCDFLIMHKGKTLDPLESNGGGIVDIICFILRIALIQASNNISLQDEEDSVEVNNEAPLILDEPFKHLSEEYVPKIGNFLRELSLKLDMQIILITHNKQLMQYADKKFIVEQGDDDISHVTEVA